jgi:hypothetical protein
MIRNFDDQYDFENVVEMANSIIRASNKSSSDLFSLEMTLKSGRKYSGRRNIKENLILLEKLE